MKNLDLEKMIIRLCLLGLPMTGGWIYALKTGIEEADEAFATCDPIIQKIHGLHVLIDQTKRELTPMVDLDTPDIYFENVAMVSQKNSGDDLHREDIRITEASRRKVRNDGSGPVIGEDIEIKVEFGIAKDRRRIPLSRSFINAFIVNCESRSPIWRLRNLKITNKAFKTLRTTRAPPDLELTEEWIVNELLFARRTPLAAER